MTGDSPGKADVTIGSRLLWLANMVCSSRVTPTTAYSNAMNRIIAEPSMSSCPGSSARVSSASVRPNIVSPYQENSSR